jgi:DNA polymerase III sliding clamp (beta) subunit (PCNA family)
MAIALSALDYLLFTDKFPDFSGVIPEFQQSATVDATALKSTIQRVLLTTDLDTRNRHESLKLTFTQDALTVESRGGDPGKSDEQLPIASNLNGEAVVFGVFGHQVLEWLAVAGEQVKVELAAPTLVRLSPMGEQPFKSAYIVCGVNLKW